MILLHTSDWHLGKHLHGVSLLEDQAHALSQFVAMVRDIRPDLVIVVGDIFDRIHPQDEALELYDSTLQQIVLDMKVKTIILPGNHDNGKRLTAGSWMAEKQGLHVVGSLESALSPITLEDADGPLHVHAIPYLDPYVINNYFRTQKIETHGGAGTALLEHLTRFRRLRKRAVRGIVAAYLQMEGVVAEGSERLLHAQVQEGVKVSAFEGLAYAALGFLHRAQAFGDNGEFCYSGSLTALDFVDQAEIRSVQKVEIDSLGQAKIERLDIVPRRQLRKFRGDWAHLLAGPSDAVHSLDLCALELTGDSNALTFDHVEQLRRRYPNLIRVDRVLPSFSAPTPRESAGLKEFEEFYHLVTQEKMGPQLRAALEKEMGWKSVPNAETLASLADLLHKSEPAAATLELNSSLGQAAQEQLELPNASPENPMWPEVLEDLEPHDLTAELGQSQDLEILIDLPELDFDAELSSIGEQLRKVEELLESPKMETES